MLLAEVIILFLSGCIESRSIDEVSYHNNRQDGTCEGKRWTGVHTLQSTSSFTGVILAVMLNAAILFLS